MQSERPDSMGDSPPPRYSQPHADGHARLDVADRRAAVDCGCQPGDREAEAADQETGGAVQHVLEGRLVACEVGRPGRPQLIRAREPAQVVEQGAGVVAMASGMDRADNRRQDMAVKRAAERARSAAAPCAHHRRVCA
jgi:hypothetical protein